MPEWTLSSFEGNPSQWPKNVAQIKKVSMSKSMSDDVKLTFFKNLVSGKLKNAFAEFAFNCAFYKDSVEHWKLSLNNHL